MDFGTVFYIVNATIPLILIFAALLMLFLAFPSTTELNSYRTSRKVIAFAYLIFGIFSGINAIMNGPNSSESDMFVVAVISLLIASFQSFLFTYTLIILINPIFFTRQFIACQLIPISSFSILSFLLLFLNFPFLQKIVFYVFLVFYLYQLVYYTYTFVTEYKRYRFAANNYFSGDEAQRLKWVTLAFFSALSVGLMVLILIIFPDPVFDLVIASLCGIFYAYFLVKYINYPHTFYILREFIGNEDYNQLKSGDINHDIKPDEENINNNLEKLLVQWVDSKAYCNYNITITSLADVLNTNRTYLSAYINNNLQMNFNTWINMLRIDEAKILLKFDTNLPIIDISSKLGYADHSSFSRQFKKITGLSPTEWRKKPFE